MQRASGRRGRRGLLLASGLLASSALAVGLYAASAGRAAPRPGHSAVRMLLRLHDLPPGYAFFKASEGGPDEPGITCDALEPGEPPPKVRAFLRRYSPAGCRTLYWRLYTVPGGTPAPLLAASAVLDRGSVKSAETALALAPEILGGPGEGQALEEAPPPGTVGEATRFFRWKGLGLLFGDLAAARAGSILAWRSGGVAALVFATGPTSAKADSAALALAQRQQARIETSTPYSAAERYDRDVLLDNPKLSFPVLWLGRTFSPGRGFARTRLLEAYADPRAETSSVNYARNVSVSSRSERKWNAERDGPKASRWACTTSRKIGLPRGFALLYGSYLEDYARCPRHPPHRFFAVVHSDGMATVIEEGFAPYAPSISQWEYGSFRGLATLARGLQVRPRAGY